MTIVKYKHLDELPLTFGPKELASILNISINKAYEEVSKADFPKMRVGSKIIISKPHFIQWLNNRISSSD